MSENLLLLRVDYYFTDINALLRSWVSILSALLTMYNHHQSFRSQGPHQPMNSRESGQWPPTSRHAVKVTNVHDVKAEEQTRIFMNQHHDFQGMEKIGDALFAYFGSQNSALLVVNSLHGRIVLGRAVHAEYLGSAQAGSPAPQQTQATTLTFGFPQYSTLFPLSNIHSQKFPSQYPTKDIRHPQLESKRTTNSTPSDFSSAPASMPPSAQRSDLSPISPFLGTGKMVKVISSDGIPWNGEHAVILGQGAVTGMWNIQIIRTGHKVSYPTSYLRLLTSDSSSDTVPRIPLSSPQTQTQHSYQMPPAPLPLAFLNNIYIKDLDVRVTHNKLLELFKPFGEIVDSRLQEDPSGLRRYAYLRYSTHAQAQEAISAMHKKQILDKVITVEFHRPKSTLSGMQQQKQQQVQEGGARANCLFFAKGICQFGSSCRNIHDESLVKRRSAAPAIFRSSTSTAGVLKSTDSADDSMDRQQEEEEVVAEEDEEIQLLELQLFDMCERAQRKGKKMWGRSKLMLVGKFLHVTSLGMS
jgi:hypothetical protein